MTILNGDSGFVQDGTLRTFTTSVATPRETFLSAGSEIALGTTDPLADTITYTIGSADLPTYTPAPYSVMHSPFIHLSGKNTTAGAVTVLYSIYLNGSAVSTNQTAGSGITAGNFWTIAIYKTQGAVVGDVIGIRVWTSTGGTGVTLNYHSIFVLPTRIEVTKSRIAKDVTYTVATPMLTLGNAIIATNQPWNVPMKFDGGGSVYSLTNAVTTVTFPAFDMGVPNAYTGKLNFGDTPSHNPTSSATANPNFTSNRYPSSISFREVRR